MPISNLKRKVQKQPPKSILPISTTNPTFCFRDTLNRLTRFPLMNHKASKKRAMRRKLTYLMMILSTNSRNNLKMSQIQFNNHKIYCYRLKNCIMKRYSYKNKIYSHLLLQSNRQLIPKQKLVSNHLPHLIVNL